jgi:uncharacterized protein YcbX
MELGRISAIFRYPVKSMAGELLDVARLSWHGVAGDLRIRLSRWDSAPARECERIAWVVGMFADSIPTPRNRSV